MADYRSAEGGVQVALTVPSRLLGRVQTGEKVSVFFTFTWRLQN
jgi:hypothetical protein